MLEDRFIKAGDRRILLYYSFFDMISNLYDIMDKIIPYHASTKEEEEKMIEILDEMRELAGLEGCPTSFKEDIVVKCMLESYEKLVALTHNLLQLFGEKLSDKEREKIAEALRKADRAAQLIQKVYEAAKTWTPPLMKLAGMVKEVENVMKTVIKKGCPLETCLEQEWHEWLRDAEMEFQWIAKSSIAWREAEYRTAEYFYAHLEPLLSHISGELQDARCPDEAEKIDSIKRAMQHIIENTFHVDDEAYHPDQYLKFLEILLSP